MKVCHNVLESRRFKVQNGGIRITIFPEPVDTGIVGCQDFEYRVALRREKSYWFDDKLGVCTVTTGAAKSFSFGGLSKDEAYYLYIERSFDHPYCCLTGSITVEDQPVSASEGTCAREENLSFMDVLHGALDLAGFIPVLGAVPDGINALIYVFEGDWTNAGVNVIAMVPGFGDSAKAVTMGGKVIIKASGKEILKKGEQARAKDIKAVAKGEKAAVKAEGEAAQTTVKTEKEAAKVVEKGEAASAKKTDKAARSQARRDARIVNCEAIWVAYNALKGCKKCKGTDNVDDRAEKIACITALMVARKAYLKEKCDYILAGSIAKGSKKAERGHLDQVDQLDTMLRECARLPVKSRVE